MDAEQIAKASEDDDQPACSFCGRTADEVGEKAVEGPMVRICRDCVETATSVFERRDRMAAKDTPP